MKHLIPLLALLLLFALPARAEELPAGARVLTDLAYVKDGHARQKLDLYLPAQPKGPILVWIHGGGWAAGDKKNPPGLGLLGMGVTLASIEYRLTDAATFPAQIQDCKAAIRWLRAHAAEYGYNPRRLGVWGASAGGHLTALLATTGTTREFDVGEHLDQSSAIQCGIDVCGPTDFPGWKPPTKAAWIQRSGPESVVVKLLGGSIDDKLELARKASPVTFATKESPPLYILHGAADDVVGPDQSEVLAARLKEAGAEVTLEIIPGAGHSSAEFYSQERVGRLMQFLARHLAGVASP